MSKAVIGLVEPCKGTWLGFTQPEVERSLEPSNGLQRRLLSPKTILKYSQLELARSIVSRLLFGL